MIIFFKQIKKIFKKATSKILTFNILWTLVYVSNFQHFYNLYQQFSQHEV